MFDWALFSLSIVFHVCRSRDVYDTEIKLCVYLRQDLVPPDPLSTVELAALISVIEYLFLFPQRCF